jgi:hypothetical protein
MHVCYSAVSVGILAMIASRGRVLLRFFVVAVIVVMGGLAMMMRRRLMVGSSVVMMLARWVLPSLCHGKSLLKEESPRRRRANCPAGFRHELHWPLQGGSSDVD